MKWHPDSLPSGWLPIYSHKDHAAAISEDKQRTRIANWKQAKASSGAPTGCPPGSRLKTREELEAELPPWPEREQFQPQPAPPREKKKYKKIKYPTCASCGETERQHLDPGHKFIPKSGRKCAMEGCNRTTGENKTYCSKECRKRAVNRAFSQYEGRRVTGRKLRSIEQMVEPAVYDGMYGYRDH